MRDFFERRPWMWIVLLLGTLVAANIAYLVFCLNHAPISVKVS